jgi:hypothetical protein
MASKRSTWNSIGKYFSALVIAAFFLPFFGVSCDGVDVVTVSGADMVGGCRPGGLISEAEDEADKMEGEMGGPRSRGGGMGGMDMKVDKVEREPLAIAALALIVLGFAAAFVKSKQGLLASFGLSLATIGVLVGLYIKVGGDLKDAIAKEKLGGEMGESMKRDVKISAGGRYGLWLSGLLLLSIAIMTGRAMREPENMPDAPPGPPPMPPPPGPAA